MPSGAKTKPRADQKRRAFPRWLFILALATCALATGWTAMAFMARVTPALFPSRTLPGVPTLNVLLPEAIDIDEPDEGDGFRQRQNLLVIGLDRRPDQPLLGRYLTDTIMVATIEPNANIAAILAFPRDLLIEIDYPSGNVFPARINESYQWGIAEKGTFAGGAQQLAHDLKMNFGIEIDHWIVLDFKGVEQLVDGLGGLRIDIPPELAVPNWEYSDDDETVVYLRFDPGFQKLDGYEAVAFGRYRDDGEGDLGRIKRQELILRTAFAQIFEDGLLEHAPALWSTYRDTVRTDIPTGLIPGYALMLKDLEGDIATYSLGDPVGGVETVSLHELDVGPEWPRQSVLVWNAKNVEYWLRRAFTEGTYANSTVEIWDGSGDSDGARARALARYLDFARGLPSVFLGPTVAEREETTIALYGEGRREMALDIAGWLGMDEDAIELREPNGGSEPDLVIVIGTAFAIPGG